MRWRACRHAPICTTEKADVTAVVRFVQLSRQLELECTLEQLQRAQKLWLLAPAQQMRWGQQWRRAHALKQHISTQQTLGCTAKGQRRTTVHQMVWEQKRRARRGTHAQHAP